MKPRGSLWFLLMAAFVASAQCQAQTASFRTSMAFREARPLADSLTRTGGTGVSAADQQLQFDNSWGLDILISNDGFGLGAFYRREFSADVSGFATFSISESKDPREVEQFDYFGQSYTPGKLNRFLVMPLMAGVQYRLFREDIVDNFRPYINAGVGPTMILVMPFVNLQQNSDGTYNAVQVDYFKSIGRGKPHFTAGGFIGFGANFGMDKSSVFGVNFRYYFTYLFSSGLPSLYDPNTGQVAGTKKDFGGFFITLNVGMMY